MHDPMLIANAEVARTNRLDRPYEVLSRPALGRIIDTPEALLAFQAAVMAAQNKPAPRERAQPFVARVDFGRWLGDCPCGDAPVVDPEWSLACCLYCGAIYRNIVMPDDAKDVESVLMERPHQLNRFWFTHETVADLRAENIANAVEAQGVATDQPDEPVPGVKA